MLTVPGLCWLCKMPLALSAWGVCSVCTRSLERRITTCPQCGLPAANRYLPCGRCLKKPPPWSALVAVDDYVRPLSRLIHALKFSGQSSLAPPLPACYCWRFYRHGEPAPCRKLIWWSMSPCIAVATGGEVTIRATCSAARSPAGSAVDILPAHSPAYMPPPFSISSTPGCAKETSKMPFALNWRLTASISRLWMMSSPQAVPLLNFPDCFCKAAPRRFRYGVCAVPCSPSSMGV